MKARLPAYSAILLCALTLGPFCGCRAGPGPGEQATLAELAAALDRQIPRLMRLYDVPGVSLGLLREGATVLLRGYGVADRKSGRKVTPDTLFEVGSISKSLTAWGVLSLVEAKSIELDAPAAAYLRTWRFSPSAFDPAGVTVRRLLSHTAGLPTRIFASPQPGEEPPGPAALLAGRGPDAGGPVRIVEEPGAAFRYSNPGYMLLELLVEEVTGLSFAGYMEQAVLNPLDMTDSSFIRRAAWGERLAVGYRYDGSPVPAGCLSVKAAGGLRTSARELARFAAAGLPFPASEGRGGGVLDPETVSLLHTPVAAMRGLLYRAAADAYGLGYFI